MSSYWSRHRRRKSGEFPCSSACIGLQSTHRDGDVGKGTRIWATQSRIWKKILALEYVTIRGVTVGRNSFDVDKVELSEDPVELLMGRMRYPSLSIHGIDGGRVGTIIPREVTGRFSLRWVSRAPFFLADVHFAPASDSLVEPQTPDVVATLVQNYLHEQFRASKSLNKIDVQYGFGALPWIGDKDHWNFQAAFAATKVRLVDAVYPSGTPTNPNLTCTTRTERLWHRTLLYARGRVRPAGVYASERNSRQTKRVAVAHGQIGRWRSVSPPPPTTLIMRFAC